MSDEPQGQDQANEPANAPEDAPAPNEAGSNDDPKNGDEHPEGK